MNVPFSSSWHMSTVSTSSSQLPLGGFHSTALDAVAGGVESAGWTFLRERFSAGVAELDCRPRFLPFSALLVCSKIFSRPPMLLKYSCRISAAFSLEGGTLVSGAAG